MQTFANQVDFDDLTQGHKHFIPWHFYRYPRSSSQFRQGWWPLIKMFKKVLLFKIILSSNLIRGVWVSKPEFNRSREYILLGHLSKVFVRPLPHLFYTCIAGVYPSQCLHFSVGMFQTQKGMLHEFS